jgi:hypothetical protein
MGFELQNSKNSPFFRVEVLFLDSLKEDTTGGLLHAPTFFRGEDLGALDLDLVLHEGEKRNLGLDLLQFHCNTAISWKR